MLPLLLVSMDVSVLYFAIPQISADLDPSGTQQLWIFDIYGFILAGLLMTMGSLGDRVGRRRLLLIGAAAFGAASLLAAYAHSAETLIAARAGPRHRLGDTDADHDGAGPHDVHRPRPAGEGDRKVAWGDDGRDPLGSVMSGVLVEHFWWGSVFLVNPPATWPCCGPRPAPLLESKKSLPGRFDRERAAFDGGGPRR